MKNIQVDVKNETIQANCDRKFHMFRNLSDMADTTDTISWYIWGFLTLIYTF